MVFALLVGCHKDLTPGARRTSLKLENKDRVPGHGLYASFSGLGARGPIQYWVSIDTDTRTVTQPTTGEYAESPVTKQRPLRPEEAATLHDELERLHGTPPPPSNQGCSDVMDILVIANGESVVVATSTCPLTDSSFGPLRKLAWSMTSWPDGSQP